VIELLNIIDINFSVPSGNQTQPPTVVPWNTFSRQDIFILKAVFLLTLNNATDALKEPTSYV
jgi:hypothetical protein